ncbi:MAG: hypothetical protein K9M82_04610 [Deltaproteobacteria bacterium]|nr:hypothetical protein [Deltaproteobacteria bacterium]
MVGGMMRPGSGSGYLVEGLAGGIYIDDANNAGFLAGSFQGTWESDIQMYEVDGDLKAYPMESGVQIAPENLRGALQVSEDWNLQQSQSGDFVDAGSLWGDIQVHDRHRKGYRLPGASWSVTRTVYSGVYTGPTRDTWQLLMELDNQNVTKRGLVIGTQWRDHMVNGRGSGAWVNWNQAATGITGGEFIGVYDPAQSTWAAVSLWNSLETGKFMELARTVEGREALQGLNIPCIEVGKATLTGSSSLLDIAMNDVTFFAYSTASAPPRIWATDSVTGSFSGTPMGQSVSLSGGGLDADFTVRRWDSGSWGANVEGGGTLQRSDGSGSVSVDFTGGAAGSYSSSSGTLQGTGSGVVQP